MKKCNISDQFLQTTSVIVWSEFLAADLEVPGSITGANRAGLQRLYVAMGLERRPLILLKKNEELLERKK
jgi:hypothetical protein